MTFFEFGLGLYVNNRLTIEIERGKLETAERVYRNHKFPATHLYAYGDRVYRSFLGNPLMDRPFQ